MSTQYNCYLGGFDYAHKNPPEPFNPDFDTRAKDRYAEVSASMEADGFYDANNRIACKEEWRRRYDTLKARDNNT